MKLKSSSVDTRGIAKKQMLNTSGLMSGLLSGLLKSERDTGSGEGLERGAGCFTEPIRVIGFRILPFTHGFRIKFNKTKLH